MKEEIKNNALNDEELNEVSGGGIGHDFRIYWCPKCQQNRLFYTFRESCECQECGGSEHEPPKH